MVKIDVKLPIIAYIYMLSVFFVVGVGSIRFKRFDRGMLWFFIFLLVYLLTEIISYTLMLFSVNNHWVLHIYDLLEFITLMLTFSAWLTDKRVQSVIRLSIPVFAVLWLVSKFTIESFSGLSNYMHPLALLVVIIVSIISLFQIFRQLPIEPAVTHRIWISGGILTYYSSSIIFYSLINYFAAMSYDDAIAIMMVHWSVGIFINLIYSVGILMVKK